jgi:hypothetical protein
VFLFFDLDSKHAIKTTIEINNKTPAAIQMPIIKLVESVSEEFVALA